MVIDDYQNVYALQDDKIVKYENNNQENTYNLPISNKNDTASGSLVKFNNQITDISQDGDVYVLDE